MKRWILVLMLVAQPVAAGPGGGYPLRNAVNLAAIFCESAPSNKPPQYDPLGLLENRSQGNATWVRRKAFCLGYVEAIADAARASLCLPEEVQTPDLIETFHRWTAKNFDDIIGAGTTAAEAIVIALAERWPCPAPKFD